MTAVHGKAAQFEALNEFNRGTMARDDDKRHAAVTGGALRPLFR
jgi:hypothetical protein